MMAGYYGYRGRMKAFYEAPLAATWNRRVAGAGTPIDPAQGEVKPD